MPPTKNVKMEKLWQASEGPVMTDVKKHLIKTYPDSIMKRFKLKIDGLVKHYFTHLPQHVAQTEGEDLAEVARIEFFETIKQWDPKKNKDIWPLAYSRISGAMKDHIRYLTKADPVRLYDWITNAAYLYLTINRGPGFEQKIDNGAALNQAMEMLTDKERAIIVGRYREDKTFKEIGDKIGLSESQVTRIYKEAIDKLKKILKS
jgi:RNA polymerase sigma factor (sigma-70 family)